MNKENNKDWLAGYEAGKAESEKDLQATQESLETAAAMLSATFKFLEGLAKDETQSKDTRRLALAVCRSLNQAAEMDLKRRGIIKDDE